MCFSRCAVTMCCSDLLQCRFVCLRAFLQFQHSSRSKKVSIQLLHWDLYFLDSAPISTISLSGQRCGGCSAVRRASSLPPYCFFGHCYQSIMPVCDGLCFCSPKLIQYQHFIPLVAEYSLVPRHVSFWFGENSFPHSTVLFRSFSSFHLIDRFNQFSLWLNTGYNSAKLGNFPYHWAFVKWWHVINAAWWGRSCSERPFLVPR